MLFWLLSWLLYGLVVGGLAKTIHPGTAEPQGFLATVGVGVVGSYVGGLLNYVLFGVGHPFSASGIIMGILGAVIVLFIYSRVSRAP